MELIRAFFMWLLILFAVGLAIGQPKVAFALEVPQQGTPTERATKLWQASRPVILKDAKANHSDAEYMKRRGPVWNAWIGLQTPPRARTPP